MQPTFTLTWDASLMAAALMISEAEVRAYFTDGRRISFLVERRIRDAHPGWAMAASEGADHDLVDPQGRFWEVRSLTRGGIYFTPSNQVGSGRKFNEEGLLAKLRGVQGFLVSDITTFPEITVHVIPARSVARWYAAGLLGPSAKIGRTKFLNALVPDVLASERGA